MHTVASRVAARWPLALIFAALAACADEPVSPKPAASRASNPAPLAYEWAEVVVTNTSGGTEPGSLRWAAQQVGANYGLQIYVDESLAGDTITLPEELALPRPTYIYGPQGGITISGNDQHRVLYAPYQLSLENVTIAEGYSADGWGSAIWAGDLELIRTTIQDNKGAGPAISAGYKVSLVNSTISRNVVGMPALRYRGGTGSYVVIDHSTIADNAPAPGIGVLSGTNTWGTTVVLKNSILANNGSPLRNCETYYGFEYQGTNISSDWECGEVGIRVADPLLQPLADNGGPNMTHAILPNSPAYNAGTGCNINIDQRGVARDAKCDVGAFEFNDSTKVTITIDPAVKVDAAGKALLTGTVKCTRDDAFRLGLELHQDQKVGKQVVDVHSASDIPIACSTTAKPWGAAMGLMAGEAFKAGAARATAQTFSTPEWVTPASAASAVKLSIVRK